MQKIGIDFFNEVAILSRDFYGEKSLVHINVYNRELIKKCIYKKLCSFNNCLRDLSLPLKMTDEMLSKSILPRVIIY